MKSNLDSLCVNTIRMLSVDCIQRANSGHPGMPMGAAPMAYVLWTRFLKHNPANPKWPDRDRFVLSAGHGSMLIYSLLHLTGYDLSLEDLKDFRQWESLTPGHPEYNHTPGVETTTGPLGQGFANGVGMAIAERYLAANFNESDHDIVDHYTYAIVSDGDLMEGVTHEAASLAGHLKLGKLIYLYDDNSISIDGSTDLSFTENRNARFESYGWQVQQVDDGNDLEAIEKAIKAAQDEKEKPSFIAVKTHIGYGSPNKQDTSSAHGEPLGPDEIKLTKENLEWPLEPDCHIPEEALNHFRLALEQGKKAEDKWNEKFNAFEKANSESANLWNQWIGAGLPEGWEKDLPVYPADAKGKATRVSSGEVLNAIAPHFKNLIGGSADLAPSNKTMVKDGEVFQVGQYQGRNFHFGVREHGMGSIMNGMALHGGLIPYGGTFLIFSDYMRPTIRLAGLMNLKTVYVFTHDSIGLGEDGPTHQPIEQLVSLRSIPNVTVIRPCDANETAEAWKMAVLKEGPVALALTRQGLPTLDRDVYGSAHNLKQGGYILKDVEGIPDIILMASGSEVSIAIEAAEALKEKGVSARLVSMPSWELFEEQDKAYKDVVLPPTITKRISIEAGSVQGWARYTGLEGDSVGLDHFGASAPSGVLYEKFGITAENTVQKALKLLGKD